MGKVVLFIATGIDGFIARPDGNLDWLTLVPAPVVGLETDRFGTIRYGSCKPDV